MMVQDKKDEKQVLKIPVEAEVWKALESVADPEIPALSLVELQIVRAVKVDGQTVEVQMTPTFMGCPALEQMKEDVRSRLSDLGFVDVRVFFDFALPWSTDLLSETAKEKLAGFGIAPPPKITKSLPAALMLPVECPFCNSNQTNLESSFGSTLCKQIYYCTSCRQSFERFKPL